jgi:uncharacterized membrane protein
MAGTYLADIVVLLHFLWVLFLIFGAFWGRRNRVVKWIHCGGLVLAFFIETFNWFCPLTYLEVWLRSRHSPLSAYSGSFIAHYVESLLYVQLPRALIVALTVGLCIMNIRIYRWKTPWRGKSRVDREQRRSD